MVFKFRFKLALFLVNLEPTDNQDHSCKISNCMLNLWPIYKIIVFKLSTIYGLQVSAANGWEGEHHLFTSACSGEKTTVEGKRYLYLMNS